MKQKAECTLRIGLFIVSFIIWIITIYLLIHES